MQCAEIIKNVIILCLGFALKQYGRNTELNGSVDETVLASAENR